MLRDTTPLTFFEPNPIEKKPEQPSAKQVPITAEPATLLSETEQEPVLVIGEVLQTYIVAQWRDSVYFIDKHAAHERLLYNELKNTAHTDSQMLLAPLTVSLSREEFGALTEAKVSLEQAGFETEEFGGNTLLVRAVPMMLADGGIAESLREIAGGLLSGKREITTDRLDWIYHSVACRAAVKAGNHSTPQERQSLAERVLLHDDIRTCPHGRPVCFELTKKEIEKQFGRIV